MFINHFCVGSMEFGQSDAPKYRDTLSWLFLEAIKLNKLEGLEDDIESLNGRQVSISRDIIDEYKDILSKDKPKCSNSKYTIHSTNMSPAKRKRDFDTPECYVTPNIKDAHNNIVTISKNNKGFDEHVGDVYPFIKTEFFSRTSYSKFQTSEFNVMSLYDENQVFHNNVASSEWTRSCMTQITLSNNSSNTISISPKSNMLPSITPVRSHRNQDNVGQREIIQKHEVLFANDENTMHKINNSNNNIKLYKRNSITSKHDDSLHEYKKQQMLPSPPNIFKLPPIVRKTINPLPLIPNLPSVDDMLTTTPVTRPKVMNNNSKGSLFTVAGWYNSVSNNTMNPTTNNIIDMDVQQLLSTNNTNNQEHANMPDLEMLCAILNIQRRQHFSQTHRNNDALMVLNESCLTKLLRMVSDRYSRWHGNNNSSSSRNSSSINTTTNLQQDCSEFLVYIVSLMLKYCLDTHASHWFDIGVNTTIFCSNCSYSSETDLGVSMTCLHLPILGSVGVSLKSYFSSDELEGYKCPQCKCVGKSTSNKEASYLPEILIISLKRFKNIGPSLTKVIDKCYIDEILTINDNRFIIRSIIVHIGDGINSGHYVCYCSCPTFNNSDGKIDWNNWYQMNDSFVTLMSKDSVLNDDSVLKNGYVLVYQNYSKAMSFNYNKNEFNEKEESRRSSNVPFGIKNIGNSCYINSVMQALAFIDFSSAPILRQKVVGIHGKRVLEAAPKTMESSSSVTNVIYDDAINMKSSLFADTTNPYQSPNHIVPRDIMRSLRVVSNEKAILEDRMDGRYMNGDESNRNEVRENINNIFSSEEDDVLIRKDGFRNNRIETRLGTKNDNDVYNNSINKFPSKISILRKIDNNNNNNNNNNNMTNTGNMSESSVSFNDDNDENYHPSSDHSTCNDSKDLVNNDDDKLDLKELQNERTFCARDSFMLKNELHYDVQCPDHEYFLNEFKKNPSQYKHPVPPFISYDMEKEYKQMSMVSDTDSLYFCHHSIFESLTTFPTNSYFKLSNVFPLYRKMPGSRFRIFFNSVSKKNGYHNDQRSKSLSEFPSIFVMTVHLCTIFDQKHVDVSFDIWYTLINEQRIGYFQNSHAGAFIAAMNMAKDKIVNSLDEEDLLVDKLNLLGTFVCTRQSITSEINPVKFNHFTHSEIILFFNEFEYCLKAIASKKNFMDGNGYVFNGQWESTPVSSTKCSKEKISDAALELLQNGCCSGNSSNLKSKLRLNLTFDSDYNENRFAKDEEDIENRLQQNLEAFVNECNIKSETYVETQICPNNNNAGYKVNWCRDIGFNLRNKKTDLCYVVEKSADLMTYLCSWFKDSINFDFQDMENYSMNNKRSPFPSEEDSDYNNSEYSTDDESEYTSESDVEEAYDDHHDQSMYFNSMNKKLTYHGSRYPIFGLNNITNIHFGVTKIRCFKSNINNLNEDSEFINNDVDSNQQPLEYARSIKLLNGKVINGIRLSQEGTKEGVIGFQVYCPAYKTIRTTRLGDCNLLNSMFQHLFIILEKNTDVYKSQIKESLAVLTGKIRTLLQTILNYTLNELKFHKNLDVRLEFMLSMKGKSSLPQLNFHKFLRTTKVSLLKNHYSSLCKTLLFSMTEFINEIDSMTRKDSNSNVTYRKDLNERCRTSLYCRSFVISLLFGLSNKKFIPPVMSDLYKEICKCESIDIPTYLRNEINCSGLKFPELVRYGVDPSILKIKPNKSERTIYDELLKVCRKDGGIFRPIPLSRLPSPFLLRGIFYQDLKDIHMSNLRSNWNLIKMKSILEYFIRKWCKDGSEDIGK